MKIKKLVISNFKGIKHFDFTADGSVSIHGANGTGKSSIADAISWLLFDKDSLFRSKFAIKPLGTTGNEIHNLETIVTLETENIELTKCFKEDWKKKRGSAKKTFVGHITDYYVDGVPCKMKDFKAKASKIAGEDEFKLLTSPLYFANELHWKDRRKIVLDVCGAGEINLSDITGKHSYEDYRDIQKAKLKKINDRLNEIPARVDEISKGIPESNAAETESDLAATELKLLELKKALDEHRPGDEYEALLREHNLLLSEYNDSTSGIASRKIEAQETVDCLCKKKQKMRDDCDKMGVYHRQIGIELTTLEARMDTLRTEYTELADNPPEDTCRTCGQVLPDDQKTDNKSALQRIRDEGLKLKEKADRKRSEQEVRASGIAALEEELQEMEELLQEAQERLSELPQMPPFPERCRELDVMLRDYKDTRKEVLTTEIDEQQQVRVMLNKQMALCAEAEKLSQRVAELEAEEKALGEEYELAEGCLYKLEESFKKHVNNLEEVILKTFGVKFQMFQEQINGGMTESCEVLVDGVPFRTGLNKSAQINTGLKLIAVLQKHYDVCLPIVVDNAEAVTDLEKPEEAQVIRLVVDPSAETLTVKGEGE